VKKQLKAVIGAVERAANQRGDMRRLEQAMARDLTYDLQIIFGKTKGRRLQRGGTGATLPLHGRG
jgi:F420-0:gamma-glutamyl ligase